MEQIIQKEVINLAGVFSVMNISVPIILTLSLENNTLT